MKRLLTILAITALFACNGDVEPSHEAQWSKDGKDSVVYVRYKDESGNWINFYMQYMLFNSLFNSGGYNACYNHYRQNEGHYTVSNRYYHNYAPRSSSVSPNTTGHHVPVKSNSSPSRSWSSGSSSSGSHSSPSSSSSSPSRSYSSPSRSSSSPSRSYSSPSRSYSSPSRSYSSPSRH